MQKRVDTYLCVHGLFVIGNPPSDTQHYSHSNYTKCSACPISKPVTSDNAYRYITSSLINNGALINSTLDEFIPPGTDKSGDFSCLVLGLVTSMHFCGEGKPKDNSIDDSWSFSKRRGKLKL